MTFLKLVEKSLQHFSFDGNWLTKTYSNFSSLDKWTIIMFYIQHANGFCLSQMIFLPVDLVSLVVPCFPVIALVLLVFTGTSFLVILVLGERCCGCGLLQVHVFYL